MKMEGPGPPAPSGFWFMKPSSLILNSQHGMEKYMIRVESDSGDIVVNMVGVVSSSETEAATNNDCGGQGMEVAAAVSGSTMTMTSATIIEPVTTNVGPTTGGSPVMESTGCSGTLCGSSSSEPLPADIEAMRSSTSCTLANSMVDAINAGATSNPENVKNVEKILPESKFKELFPRRNAAYTYTNFLRAIGKYPNICGTASMCPKVLASMFAHFQQETAGLFYVEEINKGSYCAQGSAWVREAYPCVSGNRYYGRGAKQLSWNYNYGAFSKAIFGDAMVLLEKPDLVATTWLNFAAAMWFFVTPQPPKPSMMQVVQGIWKPNAVDKAANLMPGFGVTTMIINGGLECGSYNTAANNRAKYYADYAGKLGVDIAGEMMTCSNMRAFSSGGSAGAMALYWAPESGCSLVKYQTAYSALVQGDYGDCMGNPRPSCEGGSVTMATMGEPLTNTGGPMSTTGKPMVTSGGSGATPAVSQAMVSSGSCLKNTIFYDHGKVTAYAANPAGGHCGFTDSPSAQARKYFVAISKQDQDGWRDGIYCGACVRLKHTDGKVRIHCTYTKEMYIHVNL